MQLHAKEIPEDFQDSAEAHTMGNRQVDYPAHERMGMARDAFVP
jgi:hypothetical protein